MIEEISALPRQTQVVAYEQAREWLAISDSPDIKPRLRAVAKKINGARRRVKAADLSEVLFNKPCDLEEEVLKFERERISEALAKVNGKVTHAAKLLGLNYQKLAYIIETRHPDLLNERTLVRRRPRKQNTLATRSLAEKRIDSFEGGNWRWAYSLGACKRAKVSHNTVARWEGGEMAILTLEYEAAKANKSFRQAFDSHY